ncbi:hypothetical protein HK097_006313, partial [Rhizophlyctis rosea]
MILTHAPQRKQNYNPTITPYTCLSQPQIHSKFTQIDDSGLLKWVETSSIRPFKDVLNSPPSVAGCRRVTYTLPTGGSIVHIMAGEESGIRGQADWMFKEFQAGGVPLRRCRMSAHRVKGFLTQNFSFNAGEAY